MIQALSRWASILHAVTGAKLGWVDFKEFIAWKDSEDKELARRCFEQTSRKRQAGQFRSSLWPGWRRASSHQCLGRFPASS